MKGRYGHIGLGEAPRFPGRGFGLLSRIVGCVMAFLICGAGYGQKIGENSKPKLEFSGQLSTWLSVNPDATVKLGFGHRYLPQLDYSIPLPKDRLIDFEASANILATGGLLPAEQASGTASVNPYRAWARYSSNHLEVRAGLQKINFGSAMILRPLMWFDQVDPRDPLRITTGVYGVLGRYYFTNNANIWLWGLAGNQNPRGWEVISTRNTLPEAGGRIQLPLKRGEIAGTYHFRMADVEPFSYPGNPLTSSQEHRVGVDGKFDLKVGLWFEASWIHNQQNIDRLSNQVLINTGMDYTFPIGNGMNVVGEHLIMAYDREAFQFSAPNQFTAVMASYPLGLFDNLSSIVYYDWTGKNLYAFLNWQRSFDNFSLFVLAFWNPTLNVPAGSGNQFNNFGGKGAQGLMIFNH